MSRGTVRPRDVAGILAAERPPRACSVDIDVLASAAGDATTVEQILRSVLAEVVTGWPIQTIWIINLGQGYLQGMSAGPQMLLEVGSRLEHPEVMDAAAELGWIDPYEVSKDDERFESRAVWLDNPVLEVAWRTTGIPDVAGQLARVAEAALGACSGEPLGIRIFTGQGSPDLAEWLVTEEPIPADPGSLFLEPAPVPAFQRLSAGAGPARRSRPA